MSSTAAISAKSQFSTPSMPVTLKTNPDPFGLGFQIVPHNIMQGYLKDFTPSQLKELSETYIQLRNEMFAPYAAAMSKGAFTPAAKTPVALFIGNTGSGKSRMDERVNKQRPNGTLPGVLCSADDMLMKIPAFLRDCQEAHSFASEYDGGDAHPFIRDQLNKATAKFRPAAQYMVGMLIQESLQNGLPIRAEITGKADGAVDFIRNIKKAGGDISAYVCLTTADVAAKACERRWESYQAVSISKEQARRDHKALMDNLPKLMAALDGNVTVLARYGIDEKLMPVVHATAAEYEADAVQLAKYNEHFAKSDALYIGKLMGARSNDAYAGLNARELAIA